MNTQTNPVSLTNRKSTIIKMFILTLLMTITLVTTVPISADAARGGGANGPAANPETSVENYQFSKTEVHEIFWVMGSPRGADYPGLGSAKSCHPIQKIREATAEKKAREKAVKNLDPEFGCDYYWEMEHDYYARPSCEEECSSPYTWAEMGLLNPANGDEVVEVLGNAESSEVRVKTYSTAARGCVYADAVALDFCGCDCEAKIRYPRNP